MKGRMHLSYFIPHPLREGEGESVIFYTQRYSIKKTSTLLADPVIY